MNPGQRDNYEFKDDNLNMDNWQESLKISTPVDMPTPESLRAAAESLKFPARENLNSPTPENMNPSNPENMNPSNPENMNPSSPKNLNLSHPESANSSRPEAAASLPPFRQSPSSELGQIISSEPEQTLGSFQPNLKPQSYNPVNIKTSGDKLEKSSIYEVDQAISALNSTGDLSSFYDEIRGMTEVNLNNSYGRKLGTSDEEAPSQFQNSGGF